MNYSKIAVRYAKAFFEVALEKNLLDELKKDIELVYSTCKEKDFILLLESPVIKTSQKKEILKELLSDKINELTLKFLIMVTANRRESYFPGICRNFIFYYQEHKGIKTATLTTAVNLPQTLKDKVADTIAKLFKTDVELATNENPDLIGGFVLRVGDEQLDASVASKLEKIKRNFLNTSV